MDSVLEANNQSLQLAGRPQNTTTCTIKCREGFYCESNSCLPHCPSWHLLPKAASVGLDVIVILSMVIGGISAVGVIVICGLRFKKV